MIFKSVVKTGLKDIGKNNLIKNETILEILENVGGEHSNKAGYGALDIERTGVSWVLLEWKIKVIKRPIYSEDLTVETWGRGFQKAYTYRDYRVYNSKNELCIIATSKWALIDINKRNVVKLTDEIKEKYEPEDISVFEETKINKIEIPDKFLQELEYKVGRKDIDVNNHMHNTYYLNLAYEVLPTEVYENRPYDSIRITYKKEIKLGDVVTCKYAKIDNNKHIVVIENKSTEEIHSIIQLSKE